MSRYSRRQLYQGILRRLLRWLFARHKLRASQDDVDLGSLEMHVERMPTFNENELTALERNDAYMGVGGRGFAY